MKPQKDYTAIHEIHKMMVEEIQPESFLDPLLKDITKRTLIGHLEACWDINPMAPHLPGGNF